MTDDRNKVISMLKSFLKSFRKNETEGKKEFKVIDLNEKNYKKYSKLIIKAEKECFEESIQLTSKDLNNIFNSKTAIIKIALLGDEFVGDAVGHCPDAEDIKENELPYRPDPKVMYLDNYVIRPKFQGKGHGKSLLDSFIKNAKEKGYKFIDGHYREGVSHNMIKKLGAKDIEVKKNWSDTGEDYIYSRLEI